MNAIMIGRKVPQTILSRMLLQLNWLPLAPAASNLVLCHHLYQTPLEMKKVHISLL